MAESMDLFQVSTGQIQTAANWILWAGIGLAVAALLGLLVWYVIKQAQYKQLCVIYEQIGDKQIIILDKIRTISLEGSQFFHYQKTKIFSPVFDVKYMSFFKFPGLLGNKTKLGYVIYKYGKKVTPVQMTGFHGIKPIDYDAWNYMVQRFKANIAKYERNQELMRMLPIIGLGMVVLAFIITNLLWGQHIEKMANMIISSASGVAKQMLENSGAVQVLGN